MSSDPRLSVSIQNLSKTYPIAKAKNQRKSLARTLADKARHPLTPTNRETFTALDDVSFDVSPGEAVGLIGRNGAGKSTLLKILSRITDPTSGQVDLHGRVGSLLEVGTGFHPELTGRENVYLNGAILGMTRKEIDLRFDSIVDFAEIGKFLDTPVKRYSSGMYVRLAFAVASHLEPEILIVDEVLAVGDTAFQKKCLGRMSEVATEDGRTILFVSHNLTAVEALCDRCVFLENGKLVLDDTPAAGIARYIRSISGASGDDTGTFDLDAADRPNPILRSVSFQDENLEASTSFRMGGTVEAVIKVEGLNLSTHLVTARLKTDLDAPICVTNTQVKALEIDDPRAKPDELRLRFSDVPLLPGRYWVELTVGEGWKGKTIVDHVDRAASFEVHPSSMHGSGWQFRQGHLHGIVQLDSDWEVWSSGSLVGTTIPDRSFGRTSFGN